VTIRRTTCRAAAAACLIAALGVHSAPAHADFETCTPGDANSILNAGPTIANVIWFNGRAAAGNPVDSISTCRFGFFQDGETVTFRARDTFVGQIAWLTPYEAFGWSRDAAIADTKLYQDRAWLAPVLPDGSVGAAVEQTLNYSAFKDVVVEDLFGVEEWDGRVLYQNRGYSAQLAPGEYVNTWVTSYAGGPEETSTVHIVITP
jgi:hypothetical protein